MQNNVNTPPAPTSAISERIEGRIRMNIVIVGHVDHGKSTVVGRLLADTGSLPDGKLESVRNYCARNSKPFEYAFLLDALKDEQAQGITIDTARTFFKSGQRDYIIIDAPGHIEFLKNMVTGAARAEAAVLVIDAKEGIRENSKRHGYLLSMLGIKQVAVVVNKMDLVGYAEDVFANIRDEYISFLARIGATPRFFLPISAYHGENLIHHSDKMPWYKGHNLLSAIDAFSKELPKLNQPFRMPVQDIYKFTSLGDDRRIVAGRVESGSARVGDRVVFLPSGKQSVISSIEAFHAAPRDHVGAGVSTGFTLAQQIYVGRGELMVKVPEAGATAGSNHTGATADGIEVPAETSRRLRINLFWMGKKAFQRGKTYHLKLGTAKIACRLEKINYLVDASETTGEEIKSAVERHDVADCVIELSKPLAFDPIARLEATGRFVIVDGYEIAGGGIVREALPEEDSENRREKPAALLKSSVPIATRSKMLGQKPAMVLFSGGPGREPAKAAQALETELLNAGRHAFYIGVEDAGVAVESGRSENPWDSAAMGPALRLGENASMLLDAGLIVIASAKGLDSQDVKALELLISGHTLIQLEAPADAEEGSGALAGIVKEALARLKSQGML